VAEEYEKNSGFFDEREEIDAIFGLGGLEGVGDFVADFVSHRLLLVWMRTGFAAASIFLSGRPVVKGTQRCSFKSIFSLKDEPEAE
jgi:hypothetical protein